MKSRLKLVLASPVFITGFAFAVRMLIGYLSARATPVPARPNLPYGFELGHVAAAIAEGRGFSSPLRMVQTGSTAWLTPIYPYLVAGIFKLFGVYSNLSHTIIVIMNCAFASLTIIPIHGIATRTFGKGVAVAAAWTWVFLPSALYFPIVWIWDTALIALIFSLIFWLTLEMRGKYSTISWIGYSALWALGVLINPSILSLFPFFVGWLVWDARKAGAAWAKPVTAALLVFAICLVPWTVRNERVFGKWIVLRSNFGLELWLGNNPQLTDTMGVWQHPDFNLEETGKYQRMGEVAYMAEKEREALTYMRNNPLPTLMVSVRRFELLWLGVSESPVDVWLTASLRVRIFIALTGIESLLFLLGALLAYRAHNPEAFPYAITLLVFPLVFYLTHADSRYRFPIDPILLILAISAVAHLAALARNRNPHPRDAASPAPSLPAL